MSLNNSQMLPARVRNMRQMNDVLNAEDIILAEIERIIDEMYQRASLLHEELINEEWLENKLSERTGAGVDVTGYAEKLLAEIVLDVSELQHIDMPDVRKFLDKWVPAHLMYKIILLLDYSASIGEVFSVTEMTIGFDSPYWNVRRLNGTWLLDGTYNLGVGRKPDEWGISYDMGDVEVLESVELDVSVSATSQLQEMFTDAGVVIGFDSPYWNVRRLNGTWQMDGSYELNVLRKPDTYGLAIDLGNTNIEEMTPGGVVIYLLSSRIYREEKQAKEGQRKNRAFKELLELLSGFLQAGMSLENSFLQAEGQLAMLGEDGKDMIYALHQMNQKVKVNIAVEQAYMELAEQMDLEEACAFGEILLFAKRLGGNYGKNIQRTATKLGEKMSLQEEITTMMAQKKLEMKVMLVIPLAIIAYVRLTSADLLAVLYGNLAGGLIMSACLVVYVLMALWSRRIMDIVI